MRNPCLTLVTQKNGGLYTQRGERWRELLIPEAPDIFLRKGIERRRLFHCAGGKVDGMIDRRNNEDLIWRWTQIGSSQKETPSET